MSIGSLFRKLKAILIPSINYQYVYFAGDSSHSIKNGDIKNMLIILLLLIILKLKNYFWSWHDSMENYLKENELQYLLTSVVLVKLVTQGD